MGLKVHFTIGLRLRCRWVQKFADHQLNWLRRTHDPSSRHQEKATSAQARADTTIVAPIMVIDVLSRVVAAGEVQTQFAATGEAQTYLLPVDYAQ